MSRRSSVMCGRPSRWQVSRAAMTASGEQHTRSEPGPCGSSHRRSVTPTAFGAALRSATALSTPPLIATATRPGTAIGPEVRRDRVRECVGGKRLSGNRRCLEQRQTPKRTLDARGVGRNDAVSLDREAHGRVFLAARGVADELPGRHAPRLPAPCRAAPWRPRARVPGLSAAGRARRRRRTVRERVHRCS